MKLIAGVDEVGRGSLIGPVYAAAVILCKDINKNLLKLILQFLKVLDSMIFKLYMALTLKFVSESFF